MTFSFVQFNRAGAFSGTTITVSPTSPFTSGNAVLIGWKLQPSALSVASIADGVNSYVIGPQTGMGGGIKVGYAYALGLAAGTPTITLTVSGGTISNGVIFIEEWSGIVSADGSVGNAAYTQNGGGGSGFSFNSGSFTTGPNGDLVWAWGICAQGTALNSGAGFSAGTTDAPTGYQSEFQIQTFGTGGPINPSFSTAAGGGIDLYAVGTAFIGPPPPVAPNLIGIASCEW